MEPHYYLLCIAKEYGDFSDQASARQHEFASMTWIVVDGATGTETASFASHQEAVEYANGLNKINP